MAVLVGALANRYTPDKVLDGTWRLCDAQILSGRYAQHGPPAGWNELLCALPANVTGFRWRGKFIYLLLGPASALPHISLWSTLGLSGGWTLRPDHRHARLTFTMERNLPAGVETETLYAFCDQSSFCSLTCIFVSNRYYYDSLSYGTLKVCFDESELAQKLQKLGPSWLAAKDAGNVADFADFGVSFEAFTALIRRGGKPQKRRRLAVFLMDQSKTSGVGNYILAEVLYRSRIHPWAKVGDLSDDDICTLYKAIHDVMLESYG